MSRRTGFFYFDLLEEESANVAEGARKLEEMITNFDRLEERRSEIRQTEHRGDEIVHSTYEKVNSAFVTPIDQEVLRNEVWPENVHCGGSAAPDRSPWHALTIGIYPRNCQALVCRFR